MFPRGFRPIGRRVFAAAVAAPAAGSALAEHRRTRCEAASTKLKVGGVLNEYKERPRAVQRLSPPVGGFFSKETKTFGVPIRAHSCVSDEALTVAADRLSRMLRHLPAAVHERLRRRGAAFHVIGLDQGTSDLPEHAHMKGVDGGYTGEKGVTLDQRARGMGGVQSSCGEENLIDLDTDPRYAGRDILTHEFAHCIMDVGLPSALRKAIRETHAKAVANGCWTRADGSVAYAGSNASEYFAELTMWYFGTHGEFVDRKARTPAPGPGGLAEHDPDGFRLLTSIYSGTHPALADPDPVAPRLSPAPASLTASSDDDETDANETSVEFDNRGCECVVGDRIRDSAPCRLLRSPSSFDPRLSSCSWKLYWLTPAGERKQYGEVGRDATFVQGTYKGHAWLLERTTEVGGNSAESRGQGMGSDTLTYVAGKDSLSVAAVNDDAGCRSRTAVDGNAA